MVTLRHLPESRDESTSGRFDLAGAVLGASALAGITYALTAGAYRPGLGRAPLVGARRLAVAFVETERRRANPMLPLQVFSSTQFSAVNIVTFVVYAAFGGVFFFLALQLQIVTGCSPMAAGAAAVAGHRADARCSRPGPAPSPSASGRGGR